LNERKEAMDRKFKPGDEVQLISGGPKMTVEAYEDGRSNDRNVKCVWFDDKKNLRRETFAEVLLKPYEPPIMQVPILRA
jgi:uncharacterized protein YodC (DUF2158 family)